MRVLASEAFEELSDKFFDVKAIAVQGLRGLRQLRRPRVVDMPGLKRVRQSGRYRVWRTSHSYHEGVVVRVICWFPPDSDVIVGHVQLDEVRTEPVGGRTAVLGVSGSDPDCLSGLDEAACHFVAEAPVTTGDQCRGDSSLSGMWWCRYPARRNTRSTSDFRGGGGKTCRLPGWKGDRRRGPF